MPTLEATHQMDNGAPMRVAVALGARSYDILIGPGLIDRAGELVAPFLARPRCVVITDTNVAKLHLGPLRNALGSADIHVEEIIVAAGEASKSLSQLEQVCEELLALGTERGDTLIALGGGMIGDLAGFAAAVLHRGINFIQMPTTLLAQVDSSVGGKTGVNARHGKNLIGAFHQPLAVFADTECLATLPLRELRAGYAEMVKYGLLGDLEFFRWLEGASDDILTITDPPAKSLARAISKSCEAKAAIVAQDEREAGKRALLNLGHTFGHALEAGIGYTGALLHGEAVSIGMVMAFDLSVRLGLCASADADAARNHLRDAGLPVSLVKLGNQLPDARGLVTLMGRDKKVVAGTKSLVLVRALGDAFLTAQVDDATLVQFLSEQLAP
ncbi:MAG: 3-dehydroquinate synthase [Alphaproteobacteria bacterium]